jgi:hypothetical protein
MSEGGVQPQVQPDRAPDVAVAAPSAAAVPAAAALVAAASETSVSTSMGVQGLPGSVPLTSQMMGTSLTFSIPTVSSDSVAALARHAHLIAAQLREIEARAALTALHSQLPAQSVGAAGAPGTSAPVSQHDKGEASLLYASVLGGAEKARQGGKCGGAIVSSAVAIPPGQPATSVVAADADDVSDASSSGSGGIKMRSKEGDAHKGHEVRKKNDRDKKRRKRNRIGTLLKVLDLVLLYSKYTRAMNFQNLCQAPWSSSSTPAFRLPPTKSASGR